MKKKMAQEQFENHKKFPYRIFNFGETWKARYFNTLEEAKKDLKYKNERLEVREIIKVSNGVEKYQYSPVWGVYED